MSAAQQPQQPYPPTATILVAANNPLGTPTQIAQYQQQVQRIAAANAGELQHWTGQCAQWLVNAQQCVNLGIPLPPKPSPQPMTAVLETFPSPPVFGADIAVWDTTGGPLGSPCPDLAPPPAALPPGTPVIGLPVGGPWYQALATDTMAPNAIVTVAADGSYTTSMGTSGVGQKCPAGVYEVWQAFGGIDMYLKLK